MPVNIIFEGNAIFGTPCRPAAGLIHGSHYFKTMWEGDNLPFTYSFRRRMNWKGGGMLSASISTSRFFQGLKTILEQNTIVNTFVTT